MLHKEKNGNCPNCQEQGHGDKELWLFCLMMPKIHSGQSTDRTYKCKEQERRFGDAPHALLGLELIDPESDKRNKLGN